MALESASHAVTGGPLLLFVTPALVSAVCVVLSLLFWRGTQPSYPQWWLCGLLVLLLTVVWQHIFVGSSLLSAIFSGMAVIACAALIMPIVPALIATTMSWLGLILSLVVLGAGSPAANFPLPLLALGMAFIVYMARRRAIYLSEQALVLQEEVARQESIARERASQLSYAGTIAQGLAHNLSNQLQVQVASLELAEAYLDPAQPADANKARQHVENAARASEASTALVAKLQIYAGFSGNRPAAHVVGDLCAALLDKENGLPAFEYVQDCAPGMSIIADRSGLHSSLQELLRNAQRAVEQSGVRPARIELRVSGQPQRGEAGVAFDVVDNGCGFAPDLLDSASEPFVTSQPAALSGLGLSAVSGFARMHGGRLSVLATSDAGSTVRLWLPTNAVGPYEL
ncbi:MAG: ATP-binding protein [Pseudomonadaceae bacterium]|nr:ATP-binding protein [Pseudomonadaceae bacterium]